MFDTACIVVHNPSVAYKMLKEVFDILCRAYGISVAWFVLRRWFIIFICAFVEYILII
jgi:hypothetical protein